MKNVKLAIAKTYLTALLGAACVNTGYAESVRDTVKEWVEEGSEGLKKSIDALGDNLEAIQDYLNNYHWKGLIEENATSGPATLKQLKLNGHSIAVAVHPGEKIEGQVKCDLDSEKCSVLGVYRIVVGIKGEGPQAVIANESGLVAGKTRETFTLTAPNKPGIYQIRFRSVDALLETTALNAWVDDKGDEPNGETTIGIIFVK